MGQPKRLARGSHKRPLQRFLRRKGHRVQHQIQFAIELLTHLVEHPIDMIILCHVALGDQRVLAKCIGQLSHVILQPLALIGERQLRALILPRLRNGPRDRSFVGHAKHHTFFAG